MEARSSQVGGTLPRVAPQAARVALNLSETIPHGQTVVKWMIPKPLLTGCARLLPIVKHRFRPRWSPQALADAFDTIAGLRAERNELCSKLQDAESYRCLNA